LQNVFVNKQRGFVPKRKGFANKKNVFAPKQNISATLQRVFADKQDGFASLQTSPANRNNDCDGKQGALTAEPEELADFQDGATRYPGGGASQQNLNLIKRGKDQSWNCDISSLIGWVREKIADAPAVRPYLCVLGVLPPSPKLRRDKWRLKSCLGLCVLCDLCG
jgi:hypothetical protein